MVMKFAGSDSKDTYLLIYEFQEVCMMIKLQYMLEDIIKLLFIPFTPKAIPRNSCITCPLTPLLHGTNLQQYFLKGVPQKRRQRLKTPSINSGKCQENFFGNI